MTRPGPLDEDDIIGSKPVRDETKGLGLFDAVTPAEAEREIREDFIAPPRPRPSAVVLGAGQAARADARERAARGTEEAYRRIVMAIEGMGPMTRKELAEATGMPVNTINARVSELRNPEQTPEHDDDRLITDGRRNGESIVHLKRIHNRSAA